MSAPTVYNCPSCHTANSSVLSHLSLVLCRNCHAVVFSTVVNAVIETPKVPADWSFLQIGTALEYNKKSILIVGRVRLQLQNDYKNFWTAALENGQHIWIMESFARFCILGSQWHPFAKPVNKLEAGATVELSDKRRLKGEYLEKCEHISYEGEVGNWKFFTKGFFFFQFSSVVNTAIFFSDNGHDSIEYLTGGKVDGEKLNLKNILTWDEWK